jgi:hypothetical protein
VLRGEGSAAAEEGPRDDDRGELLPESANAIEGHVVLVST